MSSDIRHKQWAVVLMATRGLAAFVGNVLISIERCGIDTNFVEVVFPANAQCELAELARKFGAQPRILEQLIDVHPLDMPSTYAEYGSPEFAHVEKYRFPALRAIMAEGKRVIYTDVDVAWMRNPLPYLSDVLDNFACAMQTEALAMFPPMFCLGFFALTDTPACFRLVDQFIEKYSRDGTWRTLQPLFRDMLVENPKYLGDIFPLPEGLFPNGLLHRVAASDKLSSDACSQQLELFMRPPDVRSQQLEPFIFHGNWVSGLENKRQLLDDAGVWFVPKNGGPIVLREPIPLFSVSDFLVHNGAGVKTPNLHIITPEGQWSYALSFIPNRAVFHSICGDQEMSLNIELRVDEGVIGVGLLQSDGRDFITEKEIWPGGDYKTITLRASTSEKFSEIVVRNRWERGKPSRATVRSIETRLSQRSGD
jgi:hypothetical protein